MITLHYNNTTLDVEPDSSSYRYRALMQKPQLVLKLMLAEYTEFPVGTWCEFQGKRYTLHYAQNVKKNATRNLELTLTMGGEEDALADYKLRNTVDGRLKFSMCAKPHEFVDMIIENLNARAGSTVWKRGTCVDSTEKTVEFNHVSLDAALSDVADAFETEWEITDGVISLCKVEHFKESPLALSYGKGNGFVPGVGRTTYSDQRPVKRVYIQGGEQNIDYSKYGSQTLLLPKSQSLSYDGRVYTSDETGNYIERTDVVSSAVKEESLDCSEIYPKRVGTVSAVDVPDAANNFYDIADSSIPSTLNYEDCLIEGETMTIIFQSGMLAGREFEVKYIHEAKGDKAARRFELVPMEEDGQTMPNEIFAPKVGDTYAVFHCMLPDAYICDNETQTGASWDMFREAAKYLRENEDQKFTFTGELQGLWAKKNWVNVGGKIVVGGYVHFTDEQFAPEGVDIRITGVKDYLNAPYSPTIEISNEQVGQSISSALREIERTEVVLDEKTKEGISYTKRRFRDAKETMEMLEDLVNAGFDNFTNGINPITVQTMQMLVGDESLQFRFVNSKTNPQQVTPAIVYDNAAQTLSIPATILQHMTLGIDSITSTHDVSEYKFWDMAEYTSAALSDGTKKYYLYAKCSKTATTGKFVLSESAIKLEGVAGYYHLLVGILNSEYDGERSFATLYGFTEVLPGRITTDKIVSADGTSYFDMEANAMKLGDRLDFNSKGDGLLRIKGTIVQSESGDEAPVGCFRGVYNSSYTYYNGDTVTYNNGTGTSTYRYIYATAGRGYAPTNTSRWQLISSQGSDGNYYEYRYRANGSKTEAPYLDTSATNPANWLTYMPSVSTGYYVWCTVAKKSAAGLLLTEWSTPTRVTGADGAQGAEGPAMVFRGEYSDKAAYYGNSKRVDVVKASNGIYYVARTDAGDGFSGKAPTNTSYWNTFGANFESIATGMLFAEEANIAGWVFNNNYIYSQASTMRLDGRTSPLANLHLAIGANAATTPDSAPFRVDTTGRVHAESGSIGGFELSEIGIKSSGYDRPGGDFNLYSTGSSSFLAFTESGKWAGIGLATKNDQTLLRCEDTATYYGTKIVADITALGGTDDNLAIRATGDVNVVGKYRCNSKKGVTWNATVGSPDLDKIRLIVEGGLIVGYYKE